MHDFADMVEWLTERLGEIPPAVDVAVDQLEPMFVRSRYPSGNVRDSIPAELIGAEEARAAVAQAEEIMAWVQDAASVAPRQSPAEEELLVGFARLMKARYRARLCLFGSRARGTARPESDYDLVAVAKAFGEQPLLGRATDRGKLWREAGGWRIALDLHFYTPEEFREELRGLGYLGMVKRRGELIEVKVPRAA